MVADCTVEEPGVFIASANNVGTTCDNTSYKTLADDRDVATNAYS